MSTRQAVSEENKKRIEEWKDQKVLDWHKGGKLKERFPDINDLRAWMESQILKARQKAQEKLLRAAQIASGEDSDGKSYRSLEEVWKRFASSEGVGKGKKARESGKKSKGRGVSAQTREQWYEKGKKYWQTAPPTIDGVLGGFGHVSPLDIADSKKFLKSLGKSVKRDRAVDLGAGIGRIAHKLLLPLFKKVDLVEQDKKYVSAAKIALGKLASMGEFQAVGLQDYYPDPGTYDVMWFQWVLGHLTDDDLVDLFKRSIKALKPNGVIVVKENMARKGFILDKDDMSVTRSEPMFREVFKRANLKIIKEAWQTKFPAGLFPVKMFALRSAS